LSKTKHTINNNENTKYHSKHISKHHIISGGERGITNLTEDGISFSQNIKNHSQNLQDGFFFINNLFCNYKII